MDKEKIYLIIVGVIVVIALVFGVTLGIQNVISRTNLCKSNGYDYYHTSTEEGYIACCKSIVKDHIHTDEKICKAFKV